MPNEIKESTTLADQKVAHVDYVNYTFIILDLLHRKCNRRPTNIIFCIQGFESEVPDLQKHYEAKGRGE